MCVRTESDFWIVPPSRGVWIPAGLRHSIDLSGPINVRSIYIDPAANRKLPKVCSVVNVSPLFREMILETIRHGQLRRADAIERRLAEFLFDQLRALPSIALQLPMPTDPRARQAAEYLKGNSKDIAYLKRLKRELGISRRTLERLFRTETNMSLGRWRQTSRLANSLQLLASGRAVTDVAFEVGYESVSAFIAAFKRFFGTTPMKYFA